MAKRPVQSPRSSVLRSAVRIRDLVHGFVYLTPLEVRVIDHPLFQRLRNIKQNDVASYVYPSLNTSRFEHSLGCLSVAGKMAVSLANSSEWGPYQRELGVGQDDFEQVCRIYALLHDIGHLPLSHLFEMAFEDYAHSLKPVPLLADLCTEWFGGEGFAKLHEACGGRIVESIIQSIDAPSAIANAVRRLTGSKTLPANDPLRPVKLLVDSEIDADRIDATARDGRLAGGEYGTYDIERLCSAVFLQRHAGGWRLAYSHKAVGSIEALLLDRCRTHTWIHFHHRIVAMKVAARELISGLLKRRILSKECFPIERPEEMALRDDVWLWSLLRNVDHFLEPVERAAYRALVLREKDHTRLLWKNRNEYEECQENLKKAAGVREVERFSRRYEDGLSVHLGFQSRVFWLPFRPIDKLVVPLTQEGGDGDEGELLDSSPLTRSLEEIWQGEPQYYVAVMGCQRTTDVKTLRSKWVDFSARWLAASH